MSLDVKGSLIDLKAEDIPLADVLKAVSGKAEFLIKSDDTMTERISCEFKGISLEKVIQQLLKNRNYALVYKKIGEARFLPFELWIVSGSHSQSPPLPSLAETPGTSYQKAWFKREFEDEDRLLNLITTSPSMVRPDGAGISITKLSEDSPFQKIGLKEGDIIFDVNGQPISTVQDFIQALKSVSSAPQLLLMIGIKRSDNSTDPIYINLH
ncbi:MAG: hypothetical protein A2169_04490 [Deltaproteobacteria bacterium RBG_13_47_9]|nr:MAG: hypothetical protein A2169_04490 [Deltaproteobacteria bacterium RBG_13_47_9]